MLPIQKINTSKYERKWDHVKSVKMEQHQPRQPLIWVSEGKLDTVDSEPWVTVSSGLGQKGVAFVLKCPGLCGVVLDCVICVHSVFNRLSLPVLYICKVNILVGSLQFEKQHLYVSITYLNFSVVSLDVSLQVCGISNLLFYGHIASL